MGIYGRTWLWVAWRMCMGCMVMEAWVSGFNGYVKEWRIACTRETPCKWGSEMENEWEENGCGGGCLIPTSLSEEMGMADANSEEGVGMW